MKLLKLDKAITSLVSQDFPLVREPFKELASRLDIKEKTLLERLNYYKKNGLIRKFSAVLNHLKSGFQYNAMVAWNIPGKFIEKSANIISSYSQVSHCYQRKTKPQWDYNLYSMIHAKTKKTCLDIIKEISKKIGCRDYEVLFSSKEYKKTGLDYEKIYI